jgi:L-iditol 2-dehydrogenase
MRAAILYGKEHIQIEQVEPAPLCPGEVRIGIEAALTCGTDLKVFRRGYHAKMIAPPAVFGHELAGIIAEVHPETAGWSVGERVVVSNSAPCGRCYFCRIDQESLCDDLKFLNGAYAESIVVPSRLVAKNLLRIQAPTEFAAAALTEPLACVVQGMEDLRLFKGQQVLVLGAGPIGLMFTALARHEGCDVTVAGRGEARLNTARRVGADEIIDLAGRSYLTAAVRQGTSRQFDAVIEAIGIPEAWEAAAQLVRKGGKVNFFGGCPSGAKISLDAGLLHYSSLTLLASFHHTPRTIRRALELIEQRVVRAADFVGGDWPLSKLPELFASMAAGNRAIKTLIRVRE